MREILLVSTHTRSCVVMLSCMCDLQFMQQESLRNSIEACYNGVTDRELSPFILEKLCSFVVRSGRHAMSQREHKQGWIIYLLVLLLTLE